MVPHLINGAVVIAIVDGCSTVVLKVGWIGYLQAGVNSIY